MRLSHVILGVLVITGASALAVSAPFTLQHESARPAANAGRRPSPVPPDVPKPIAATEQQWIHVEILEAIAAFARHAGSTSPELIPRLRQDVHVVDHVWSAGTYAPVAERWFGAAPPRSQAAAAVDLNARERLVDLTVDTLLHESARVSDALTGDVRSPDAHEAAALVIGAFALRESRFSVLSDVRPMLSRMTAHLASARALRGSADPRPDGAIATIIMTALVGHERTALAMVDALDRPALPEADRAWMRALRWRITGDWRRGLDRGATRLERFEYARALRSRLGINAFLAFLDDQPLDVATDWQRIAFARALNVEAGHRFTPTAVDLELAEARRVWVRLHGGTTERDDLVRALNARPNPVPRAARGEALHVLDWGMWAAFHQRHLCQALMAVAAHERNLGHPERHTALAGEFERPFGEMTLYPVVLRRIADTRDDYEHAVQRAHSIVQRTPEQLTAAAWNLLLQQPRFTETVPFPLRDAWFSPLEPAGTAFDLVSRSLAPGCRRPPTLAQSARFAALQPFSHWTRWADEFFKMERGAPSLAKVKKAFGSLLEYDANALLLILDHLPTDVDEQIALARQLCTIAPDECGRLADLLLREGHEEQAVAAYERWISLARDSVALSHRLRWLVRYYHSHGQPERAEAVAHMAADTGSAAGLEILMDLLLRSGREDRAEQVAERIAERYDDTTLLGIVTLRQALKSGDRALERQAIDLLRAPFPDGVRPLALHALDVTPLDGMVFQTFGRRAARVGLEPGDIVVGVDEWRVHHTWQYYVLIRLRDDDLVTLTVWRDNAYQQLRIRMPERWLGVMLRDYRNPRAN